MVLIIILLLVIAIGLFLSKNQSVKSIFKPVQKYHTIDDEYNAKRKERQDEIDKLLSKIGKNGLDDLTEKERKRLDELSKK
ncbi:MAG: rhomboid family protein [Chryseobacterium sp.]|nr:MAG: rhomboid family protein [Chryseobacterium sp.]